MAETKTDSGRKLRYSRQVLGGVLTTGQVAEICRTSTLTVYKWLDRGDLKAHTLPGAQRARRRIEVKSLREFMENCGMPVAWLDEFLAQYKEQ